MRRSIVSVLAFGALAFALSDPVRRVTAQPAALQPAPAKAPALKGAASKIASVTVYPSAALVTREIEAAGAAGRVELVVSPLPLTAIPSSLYAEGADGIRVLTTRFRTRPVVEDTREEVKKLQAEIAQLQLAREKIEGDLAAQTEDMKMLGKMESFLTVTTVQATEKGALNAEAAIALAKHIRETRGATVKENVTLKQAIQANTATADLARKRLAELTSGVARIENDAVITVEKANAAAGTIRLSYLVDRASWRPQYKLRAGKAAADKVTVEYLAAVTQDTGEDWADVGLVLSTAQPMLNAAPPELHTLNVTVAPKGTAVKLLSAMDIEEQVHSLRSKAQKDFNERKQTSGVGLVNTAAAHEQSWELFNPEAAMKRGCRLGSKEGPTVSYTLATKLAVPSRPDEQVLEVAKIELTPDYYYKAVPLLSQHVYRLADLVNKSNYVLLPGEATMYTGTDFVGRMTLPLVAVGEQFTAGFGVDPQLQVQRQMVDKMRTTQGGNQLLRYDYRILVSSFKAEKVRMQVWERLPYAETDAVNVSLAKTAPELSKDALYQREQRPTNLLRWDMTVEPNTHGEKATPIHYEFKLELDRQMTLSGFQSASLDAGAAHPPVAALPPINPADRAKIAAAMEKLSAEDRKLAEAQVYCAIDWDSPLGTMGPIYKVMAKGQPVFVCCKGCDSEARAHPDDALAQLQKLMTRVSPKR